MAVKHSQSAVRALAALERIAVAQPIGVSALAKLMDEDRSATQRTVQTLAEAGWIQPAPLHDAKWELSPRLFMLAQLPRSGNDLNKRAFRMLETIREDTGETAFLAIPQATGFVVVNVLESLQLLRVAPRVGQVITVTKTATGRAILAHADAERQKTLLGHAPDDGELDQFAATRARGYAISVGEIAPYTTNIAAAILDAERAPVGAIAICAPSTRVAPDRHAEVGDIVAAAARALSAAA